MRTSTISAFWLALALAAAPAASGCSDGSAPGDDDDDVAEVDGGAGGAPDATGGGGEAVDAGGADGAAVGDCPASLDYGAVTLSAQSATGEGAANARANLDAIGDIDGVGQKDQLNVLMYSETGAFGEILPTGTFELTGIETDFATCGLCVMLYAGVGVTIDDVYMPVGGTITITRYDPTFQAQLSGVTMRHVDIDPTTFATAPHADGCTSEIESATFDVAIANF